MPQTHLPSKYITAVCIVLSAVLALLRFDSLQIGTSYDDAHYIILAESLAGGQGYQLINFPRPQIERNFPPGWPLLLAPFTLAFPKNYDALKIVSLILWLASIPLVHKFSSKRIASPHLEILTALVALNPLMIGSSVTVMSESAYLFFTLLALTLFDKSEEGNAGWLICAAVLAFYSQQIRAIGIALTLSLSVVLLLSRRFRDFGVVAVILVIGFAFQAWFNLGNGGSLFSSGYEAQALSGSLVEKAYRFWSNASGYFNEVLAGSLIPAFSARLENTIGFVFPAFNLVVLALVLTGMLTWKPKLEWAQIYLAVYLAGVLTFWNPQVGSVKARFLIPILPFLYLHFLNGLKWLTKGNSRIALGVSAVIAIILIARNLQDWRSPVRLQTTDLSIGASWIAENAPPGAIVMVNEPVPAYAHVKRLTINFPKNDRDLEKYIENQGIDYIVIAPPLQSPRSSKLDKNVAETLAFLRSSPKEYRIVFEDEKNNTSVFEYTGGAK